MGFTLVCLSVIYGPHDISSRDEPTGKLETIRNCYLSLQVHEICTPLLFLLVLKLSKIRIEKTNPCPAL